MSVAGLFLAFFLSLSLAQVQGPFFFEQLVDHFSGSNATFQQKYFKIPGSGNVVFLYISGEAPLAGFENDEVLRYAGAVGATVLTLEHRYYGSSLPTGSVFSTHNLRFLTVEQALADLAHFVQSVVPASTRVITFGCSYAGAMRFFSFFFWFRWIELFGSAWFRVRYPNVTAGSISSSGVVNPILNFVAFDHQVAKV